MIRFPFSKPKGDTREEREEPSGDEDQARTEEGVAAPPDGMVEADDADLEGGEAHEDQAADQPPGPPRFLRQPEESEHETTSADPEGFGRHGAPDMAEQIRMVEAMLFASERPLSTAELASRMPIGCDAAVAVRKLEEMYEGRGVTLARVAGKWAFRTAADLAWLLAGEAVEQRRLSRAAIETLAIIAYHQPVTRAEIEEIRQVGVSKGTIDLLMELEWVKLGRRRQTPGRPVTFVTTDLFLETFGLESTKDLPRLEELRQAGLLESRPPVGFGPGVMGEGDEDELEDDEDDEGEDRDQADLLI